MKTILLADSEPEYLRCLSEGLWRLGHRVVVAPDCRSALAVFKEGISVDLVIADYMLPDMSPAKFIPLLKRSAPGVPVIVLTACGSVEIYLQVCNLGALECLIKPVTLKELDRIIRIALGEGAMNESPSPDCGSFRCM